MTKEYIERGALEAKAVYMHGFGKNKYVPLKAIQQAPAADVVEVKHGRWEFVNDYESKCTNCKEDAFVDHNAEPRYCPNCGAKMDGECREG